MQSHAPAGDQLVERRGSALPLYASLIGAQWLLLRFVVGDGGGGKGPSVAPRHSALFVAA